MRANTFDYIIIGGGTAGCLLANRLSADAGKRVLMIEAGGRDDYHWIHIPVGYLYCIGNPRTDWLFQTEADPGLNGRSLRYPRGKTLGGSSSINGMIYMRGQARDYERWAELTGDDAWRWDSVLAAFRMHEDHYKLDPAHGPVDENFRRLHGHRLELHGRRAAQGETAAGQQARADRCGAQGTQRPHLKPKSRAWCGFPATFA